MNSAPPASTGVKPVRPSFAAVAAGASQKPPSAPLLSSNNKTSINQNQSAPSLLHEGAVIVTPSNDIVHSSPYPTARNPSNPPATGGSDDELEKQLKYPAPTDTVMSGQAALSVTERRQVLGTSDDIGTLVSSSSGSNKRQSLDGKSLTSGTTFALDEKESLRPDDSASTKAIEDEDVFSPPSSGLPGSRVGSDDGRREFQDQYREISMMDQSRRGPAPQAFASIPKGVLYIPPQGLGVGMIPDVDRDANQAANDGLPDPKLREALDNPRDRIWVLKLEQDIVDFVNDEKETAFIVPQCHSFYRLLAHKIADYYMLGHHVDESTAAVRLYKTGVFRLPPRLGGVTTTPSTAASTPPPSAPQMKILRRGVDRHGPVIANGSKSTSENGEDSNGDDKKAKALSREEREAKYEAARLRIMGSAKPSEGSDTQKDKQDSRSSSAAGKKSLKKSRVDNDDDFEARSAYSNYYAPTFGSESMTPMPHGFTGYPGPTPGQYPPNVFGNPAATALQQGAVPGTLPGQWPRQSYPAMDPSQSWDHGQSGGYDLAADFQRAMSFSNSGQMQGQSMSPPPHYPQQFPPQYPVPQQGWPQQQHDPAFQTIPNMLGNQYQASVPHNHNQTAQPYAYGQLPSQSFPGRPQHKLEHPVPGSYKSKHFNPQSQTFIPGQSNSTPVRGFGSPAAPGPLQRQSSSHSQTSGYGSPQPGSHMVMQAPLQTQSPMTHPLPQPVFPHQPSPLVPLPPKPTTTMQSPLADPKPSPSITGSSSGSSGLPNQSITAKWGTPASLPAKPPPSADPFEAARLAQFQRSPFAANSTAPRQPSGPGAGFPPFGNVSGGLVVNGTGVQSPPIPRP